MDNRTNLLIRARREALEDISFDLSDEEYVIAERAVDKFMDKAEDLLREAEQVFIHQETGALDIVIHQEEGSTPDSLEYAE